MSNKPLASDSDGESRDLEHVELSGLWYTPTADERDQVRTYLTEIEDAINVLPELTPEVDGLDVGYDPTWPEVPQ